MRRKLNEIAKTIRYLTEKIHEKNSNKQVGKTLVQKMLYLLAWGGIVDLDYTLYHYGPFSREVERSLEKASDLGLVDIEWRSNKGYYIREKGERREKIEDEIKEGIREIVEEYKGYSANKLSIIATALYIIKHFDVTKKRKLINQILSLKPNNRPEWVKETLKEGVVFHILKDEINEFPFWKD